MKDSYDRSMSMQCPTCGGESFEHDEDKPDVRCVRCDLTLTKDELREANGVRIEEEVEALKAEVLKDVKADFAKIFKKWK
jgi:transcription initiation factor TFIIIB Brf1 subunit/transcription initiation factor TFIIB